jgi:hypothetical protein
LTNYKYYNTETISNFRFQNAYWDNAKNNFVIDTYSDFYNSADTNYYHLFKPVKPLQKLIEKQVARFLKPTTGIHIRRTDNIKSIQKSTTRLFIDMVTHLLEKDSNQLFYLSTDDLKTETLFKAEFGDYIICQDKKDFKRDSSSGIESAVIDLFNLSETRNILGSYHSSFSEIAAKIKGIPLRTIV